MWRRVGWEIVIGISEERNTSVLRVKQALFLDLASILINPAVRSHTHTKLVMRKYNA
jgi:hypothetical protein